MKTVLQGLKVAILAEDGFEQSELESPMEALRAAGATVSVVSPKSGSIVGMRHMDKGRAVAVHVALDHADAENYAALLIPGGLYNPDALRSNPAAVEFVRAFARNDRLIAAICHGPWLLAEADLVRGRRLTSWPAIQTDLRNAGAEWVDEPVVVDGGFVTSRQPDDLPAFNQAVIDRLSAQLGDQAATRARAA